MRFHRTLLSVVLASATVATGSGQTQRPVFRTETDAVTVSVSVRQGNRPVPGLTSSDFQLLDNGVPQEVGLSDVENLPVDVTFILGTNGRMATGLEQRHKDIIAMGQQLRREDRLRLIEAGREIVEVMPFETRGTGSLDERVRQSLRTMPPDAAGYISIHDALVMSMIVPKHSGRRQLALALVSSPDGLSIASPGRTLSVARVTETVLHIVVFEGQIRSTREISQTYRFFGPYPFLTLGPLNLTTWREDMQAIAEATGGEIHTPGVFSGARAASTFDRVMTAYRESYLLRYQPTGVQREGWHQISVKVTKPGRYNVEARRGYFVESVPR